MSARPESGFTLVELLVVMAILTILAAIAVPTLFNQRDKAFDARAKVDLTTGQRAIEALATTEGGGYAGATVPRLIAIEGPLAGSGISVSTAGPRRYELVAPSASGTEFRLALLTSGEVVRSCDAAGSGGCLADGSW